MEIVRSIHETANRPVVQEDATQEIFAGSTAGTLLIVLMRVAKTKPQRASISIASDLARKGLLQENRFRRTRGEKVVPASSGSINNAWASHRPVAHLWAAFNILNQNEKMLANENLLEFLGTASWFAEFAMSFKPSGSRQTTIERGEIWAIPPSIQPIEYVPPALSEHEQRLVDQYRHRTRH